MKSFNPRAEIPQIILVLLPFLYLAVIWNNLPAEVPLHWNFQGEIDRYGSKQELILIPILLPLLMYILMWIIPLIDPKGTISNMGRKYDNLKFIMVAITSFIAITILHIAKNEAFLNLRYLVLLFGILYVVFGNYFKTIRANYFIGIRTPWTLENETVWKKTHRLAGYLWLPGGIIVMILSLILENKPLMICFLAVTAIITLIPVVYSYITFRKLKNLE